jgi:hypothetical protein
MSPENLLAHNCKEMRTFTPQPSGLPICVNTQMLEGGWILINCARLYIELE